MVVWLVPLQHNTWTLSLIYCTFTQVRQNSKRGKSLHGSCFCTTKGISMSVLWLGFSVITQYTKIQTKIKPLPIHHKFADLQYLLQLLLFLWCLACFSSMFQCSMGKKRSAHTVERGNLVQIQLKEDKYEEKNCFRKRIKHVWSVHKVLWKDLLDDCLCISTVLHE
jgi:hypothetical protein